MSFELSFTKALDLRRFILLCIFIGTILPIRVVAQSTLREKSENFPVDYFEQWELPISVNNASLERKQDRTLFTARITNRGEEGITGVAFVLMSISSKRAIAGQITWVEKLDLEPGELREFSLRLPKQINATRHGKLVLGIDEIFGNKSIWVTLKVHETLEAYGTGAPFKQPTVKHVTNTVDSPP